MAPAIAPFEGGRVSGVTRFPADRPRDRCGVVAHHPVPGYKPGPGRRVADGRWVGRWWCPAARIVGRGGAGT